MILFGFIIGSWTHSVCCNTNFLKFLNIQTTKKPLDVYLNKQKQLFDPGKVFCALKIWWSYSVQIGGIILKKPGPYKSVIQNLKFGLCFIIKI